MANVIIAGDLCLSNRVVEYYLETQQESSKDIFNIVHRADFSLINLECPLSNEKLNPIEKQGPSLIGNFDGLSILEMFGFKGVTLSNNHILDYGDKALWHTISELDNHEILHLGAGLNIFEASKILYLKISDVTIAFINCCEHEFSIASENSAGANPLNPITQFYQIMEAKSKADFVILIIHGGVEHFQYPTTRMVQTYRFFVDAGADAVINHHQHCPCGYELYKSKPIYYGLGNFCFDWEGKRDSIWNLGYMVKLSLTESHQISSEIIPYRQCGEIPNVEILKNDDLINFHHMMKGLCNELNNEKVLKQKLIQFNSKNDYLYKKMLEPYSGRFMNGLYRRGLLPSFITKERILALMDFIICESHHERVKEYLERTYIKLNNE